MSFATKLVSSGHHGSFKRRRMDPSIITQAQLAEVATAVRAIKADRFTNQQAVCHLFCLMKRLFEVSEQDSSEEQVTADWWIAEQSTQARKKHHEPRVAELNAVLIAEDITYFLAQYLRSSDLRLVNNAAALVMLITNCFEHTTLHKRLADQRITPTLIQLIRSPSQPVQFWVIGILRNLARTDEYVKAIREEGGIHPLVDTLAGENTAKGIAASALANLAYDNEENRRIIAERGGIALLVRVIGNTKNKQVLWEATGALGNLSYKSEENKQRIVQAGGIEILTSLLTAQSEDVVATAASTLENLCSNSEEFRIRCASAGAIPKLVDLLTSSNEAVQDGSCGALFNLSINVDNRNIIVEQGAIPRVVQLLSSPNDDVLYRATGVLHNVSCNNHEAAQSLDSTIAIPRIIDLLLSKNELIQENASGTLMNLGCVDTKALEILQSGGIKNLVTVLTTTENDQVAYRVCGALFNICFGQSENGVQVVHEGGVKALVGAVKRSSHPKVIEYSLGTLAMLAQHSAGPACAAIVAENGIGLIFNDVLKVSRSTRVIAEAVSILNALASNENYLTHHMFLPLLIQCTKAATNEHVVAGLDSVYHKAKETLHRQVLSVGFTPLQNSEELLGGFEALVNAERFHDLVLILKGHRFYAHKAILFSRSEYFRAMFDRWLHNIPSTALRRTPMSGRDDESFYELPMNFDDVDPDGQITPEVFVELLRYLYTGSCNFNSNNVVPLLLLAGLYNEPRLSALAERELFDSISIENYQDMLQLAMQFSAKDLHKMVIAYTLVNVALPDLPAECIPLLTDM